jgi:hypothetical protein
MGMIRKNAADIKLAVDAIELCFERDYVTTFVIGTGDSDFTPLVHKLRELNRRVIGIGVEASTSALLPPACDEFLFYERLEGIEIQRPRPSRRGGATRGGRGVVPVPPAAAEVDADTVAAAVAPRDYAELVTQTLSGLERSTNGPVLASMVKRTILRKDPTFDEGTYGFRGFAELLRHLAQRGVVELAGGATTGDPEVRFPERAQDEDAAFELLRSTVERLQAKGPVSLSGLKSQLRKRQPDFTEKRFGFSSFLQFCKAAQTRGLVEMTPDAESGDYVVRAP